MSRLRLSVAIGDYDRTRPLADGSVRVDGVTPDFLLLSPEEVFLRAFRHADFDVCELSLSSFTVRTARGDNPCVGIPVVPSRAFRHTSIVVRTDRGIRTPRDLKGLIGIRRALVEKHSWLPATLLKAFCEAKDAALQRLADTSAAKVTLPFVEEQLVAARRLMGADFWSYGFDEVNRSVRDAFLGHHHAQGLSARRLAVQELFHPASPEMYRI